MTRVPRSRRHLIGSWPSRCSFESLCRGRTLVHQFGVSTAATFLGCNRLSTCTLCPGLLLRHLHERSPGPSPAPVVHCADAVQHSQQFMSHPARAHQRVHSDSETAAEHA